MPKVRLRRAVWRYDQGAQLGARGGFGAVFAGESEDHSPVAIKRLHLTADEAGHREIRVADDLAQREMEHVMQVLDAGEDAESGIYHVVMPRAERSLQDEILVRRFGDEEAAEVLGQIAKGLAEVEHIVHRDLKPGNVLLHQGKWKIADFGIARFVEESTSLETLNACLSAPYAAPEQWRLERATHATDIYSLACIGYSLLTGRPPFPGPTREDYREQHLNADPPSLEGQSARLRALLAMMLRKIPATRPTLARVRQLLEAAVQPRDERQGFEDIVRAGAAVVENRSRNEQELQRLDDARRQRTVLAQYARGLLLESKHELFERIVREVPAARRSGQDLGITLGRGELRVVLPSTIEVIEEEVFGRAQWNIVTGGWIRVQQTDPSYMWESSLWYGTIASQSDNRWYEVSYRWFATVRPDVRRNRPYEPFALSNPRDLEDAVLAVAPITHIYTTAFGPQAIDDEAHEDFHERWAAILARAAEGRLGYPSHMPLRDGFWRRPAW